MEATNSTFRFCGWPTGSLGPFWGGEMRGLGVELCVGVARKLGLALGFEHRDEFRGKAEEISSAHEEYDISAFGL